MAPVLVTVEYVNADGQSPFGKWLLSLRDVTARAEILSRLARFRGGKMGDCKSLGSGIFELRVDVGPGYRVYFALPEGALVCQATSGINPFATRTIAPPIFGFRLERLRANTFGAGNAWPCALVSAGLARRLRVAAHTQLLTLACRLRFNGVGWLLQKHTCASYSLSR